MKGNNAIWYDQFINNQGLEKGRIEAKRIWQQIGDDAEKASVQVQKLWNDTGKASAAAFSQTSAVAAAAGKFAESVFKAGGDSAKDVVESLRIQKQVIKELEAEYKSLEKQVAKTAPGTAQSAMQGQLSQAKKELDDEKKLLQEIERAHAGYKQSATAVRTQIMAVRETMTQLVLEGKRETQEYKDKEKELGRLGAAYSKVQTEQKALTTGGGQWAGVISGLQGVMGMHAAGQEVLGMFIRDNEKLALVQTRLQSVMSILTGMQAASNMMHQASAFRIVTVRKVTELYSAAQGRLAIALGVSAVAAKVLMGVLTLGLSVAIGGVVYAIDRMNKKKAEAVAKDAELHAQIVQSRMEIARETEAIDKNFAVLDKAEKGTNAYERAKINIQSNYGKYLSGLDAETRALDNVEGAYKAIKTAAIDSINARAKAAFTEEASKVAGAKMSKATGDIRKSLIWAINEGTLKQLPDQINGIMAKVTDVLMDSSKTFREKRIDIGALLEDQGVNPWAVNWLGNKRGLLNTSFLEDFHLANEEMAGIGRVADQVWKSMDPPDGIVGENKAFWEQQRNNAQEALDAMNAAEKGSKEWVALEKQIAEANEKISLYSQNKPEKKSTSQTKSAEKFSNDLKDRLLDLQNDIAQAEINDMSEGSAKKLAQLDLNHEKELEKLERHAQETLETINEIRKAQGQQQLTELPAEIAAQYEAAGVLMAAKYKKEKEDVTKIDTSEILASIDAEMQAYNEYLAKYGTMLEKKLAMTELYAVKIAAAATDGERMGLEKELEEGIKKLELDALVNSDDWVKLFRDLDKLTAKEITRIVKTFKSKAKEMLAAGTMTLAEYNDLLNQLGQAEATATQKNPFAALVDGIKEYREAIKKANEATTDFEKKTAKAAAKEEFKKSLEKAQEAIKQTAEALTALQGLFSELGVDSIALNTSIEMLNTLASTDWTNPMGAITGGLKLITSLISGIFGSKKKKKEKEIQRLQDQVDSLQKSYESLGRSIDKAYSTDASKLIAQQDQNLRAQRNVLQKQINAERGKKSSDHGRIKEWENAIADIDRQIGETKDRQIEAIIGKDIKSAIDEFANAYIDAWAAGEDKAASMKEVVRKMVKSAVTELMKSKLAPEVEGFMKDLSAAMEDGKLSSFEEWQLDNWESRMLTKAAELDRNFEKYLNEAESEAERQSASRGIDSLSQDSADELNGRLTVMQQHTHDLRENSNVLVEKSREMAQTLRQQWSDVQVHQAQVLRHLSGIENNTNPIPRMADQIEEIATRGVRLRQ